ncbi:MAG: hypothetical protein ABA06_00460 [Parcubacteria bacterium C7867-001]|nr:MAG: hypothetical protein ABA06_00460 [Parcubacteria bacterium C7867-001]
MRQHEIRMWVKQLGGTFKEPKPPVDTREMEELFKKKRYTEMIGLIRDSMKLQGPRLRIGYVNSGGKPTGLAWINMPNPMPMYGTAGFNSMELSMFIRKNFLETAPFGLVAMAISHECSHVVLNSLHHPLKTTEECVDLTAMYNGYRNLFATEYEYEKTLGLPPNLQHLLSGRLHNRLAEAFGDSFHSQFGYLTIAERKFAATLMQTRAKV